MKRLNSKTGLPFKYGDTREDGYLFKGYKTNQKRKDGFFTENWSSPKATIRRKQRQKEIDFEVKQTKSGHVYLLLKAAKVRAKKAKLFFDLTVEYLLSIAPNTCPVLGVSLGWCERNGSTKAHSPSLDRIVPEIGYVEGNVQWVSHKANTMKQNATFEELHQFADWVKETIPKS